MLWIANHTCRLNEFYPSGHRAASYREEANAALRHHVCFL
jgi:hypothetical protein